MRKGLVLQARPAKGPAVEGYALVCPNSILGWNGLDARTGEIIESGHIHQGESIKGKVLVVPCSRGSIAWSDYFDDCQRNGVGPVGFVFTKMDSKCGTAILATQRPCVADFPEGCDPCQLIHDGDYVRLDGDKGTVEILIPAEEQNK
ncbi:MAG: DUF126 domain-containing protein [Ruminococcaceae bacterium]|jgi:hypothetical protein|nr:DUF126 domain-containing protein [Oscillospiraceae bacterium]